MSFSENLSGVEINEKWGYIDKTGKLVIPAEYDDVFSFEGGLAKVEKNGLFGIINAKGEEIIPCKYTNISICLINDENT